jgi:hypothetical protein
MISEKTSKPDFQVIQTLLAVDNYQIMGRSPSTGSITSSIWLGNTLTPE